MIVEPKAALDVRTSDEREGGSRNFGAPGKQS